MNDERTLARLFGFLAIVVTIAWLIGYLAPIWQPDYTPPPELNLVMMAIVGVFVSLYQKARKPKSSDDPTRPTSEDDPS